MSIEALNWAFNLPRSNVADKAVLLALANHCTPDGRCWPGVERIALYTGLTERAVRLVLRRLEQDQLIQTQSRSGTSNLYTLPLPPLPASTQMDKTRHRIFAAWDFCCAYCDAPANELDHVQPRADGGSDRARNLVPSCTACNRAKSALDVGQFLADQPERLARIREWTNPEGAERGSQRAEPHSQREERGSSKPKRTIKNPTQEVREALSPEWWPPADQIAWAASAFPTIAKEIDHETHKFVAHSEETGRTHARPLAAWRRWISNAAIYAARSNVRSGPAGGRRDPASLSHRNAAVVDRVLDDLLGGQDVVGPDSQPIRRTA